MIRPISVATWMAGSLRCPPADPITPTVILRRRRALSSLTASKVPSCRSDDPARESSTLPSTRHPPPSRAFDPTPPCAYTGRPLRAGPHILAESVHGIAGSHVARRGVAFPGARLLALCGALLLAGCGGPERPGPASSIGPAEGSSHPMVGQRAPDFAAQDPSGPWLPLASLKDKPV